LSVELPPGLDLGIPEMIGGTAPIPMRLHDIVVPRIGVEWDALHTSQWLVQLRAGYVYEASPFPVQSGATNVVDSSRHSVSHGVGARLLEAGRRFPGHLNFDAYLLYAHVSERDHNKLSVVDPVGDYRAGGRQFGAGLQVEMVVE
jgi:long-chain fatty acid transport protein